MFGTDLLLHDTCVGRKRGIAFTFTNDTGETSDKHDYTIRDVCSLTIGNFEIKGGLGTPAKLLLATLYT